MKKLINFLKKHSFYVILTICLVVLGAVAFATGGNKAEDSKNPVATNVEKETGNTIEDAELVKKEKAKQEKAKKEAEAKKTEVKEQDSVATNAKPKAEVVHPVKDGLVTRKFTTVGEISKDGKSSTTYPGIDIEIAKGTEVISIADGEVVEAQSGDSRYGNYVSVKCLNGLTVTYGNLDVKLNVKKGDKVTQGQILGKTGSSVKSGPAVRTSKEYLVLEVKKEVIPVDPLTIIKDLKVK